MKRTLYSIVSLGLFGVAFTYLWNQTPQPPEGAEGVYHVFVPSGTPTIKVEKLNESRNRLDSDYQTLVANLKQIEHDLRSGQLERQARLEQIERDTRQAQVKRDLRLNQLKQDLTEFNLEEQYKTIQAQMDQNRFYKLQFVTPNPNIDYKLIIIWPDPTKNYK